jgi:hypothetical protein
MQKNLSIRGIIRLPLAMMSVGLCLVLTGCDSESDAKRVLPSINEYFPNSVLYSFDKRVLWIQTDVTGIGDKMALSIYAQACQNAVKQAEQELPLRNLRFTIQELMNFDQHSYLIIGFRGGIVAWHVRDGIDANGTPRCQVLGWSAAKEWLQEHLGYVPTPQQISVVTYQIAESTPKGQPMQCPTLAQVQQAKRQQQQAALQDYIKKQELLQNP